MDINGCALCGGESRACGESVVMTATTDSPSLKTSFLNTAHVLMVHKFT